MTDNVELTERIDQTLHDVEKTLVTVRAVNAETLTDIQGKLWDVYDKASQAGDSKAMEAIEQSWVQVQQMNNAAVSAVDAAQTIGDLARELKDQRQQALTELKELSDAVILDDRDHPLVRDLASNIEEEIYEYQAQAADWMSDDGEARTEAYDEIRSGIQEIVDRPAEAVEQLVDALNGSRTMSREQIVMLQGLIDSLYADRPVSDAFSYGEDWDDEDEDGDDDDN